MKTVIALVALFVVAGALAGCNAMDPCNPCNTCVSAPVYQSPCCPAPSGSVDGNWGAKAGATPPAGMGASGACGGGGACG
jgi:hypothetical protein